MIRGLVDYALNNRFLILAIALLLLIWGAISFHNLPVEAYPDVANNYVTVITQWPGRAAEEVEQQVSIRVPLAVKVAISVLLLALVFSRVDMVSLMQNLATLPGTSRLGDAAL